MLTHPHAHTGLRVVGLVGGHQIVEFAVEVGHRQHGQHTREGLVLSLPAGGRHIYRLADRADSHAGKPRRARAAVQRSGRGWCRLPA